MDKVNLYISSKNKKQDELNECFDVVIPQGLLRLEKDESLIMNVDAFHCVNSIYQSNEDNNYFQFIFINTTTEETFIINCFLPIGNPNVLQIKNYMNQILSGYVNVTYDSIQNKFIFTKITSDFDEAYLNLINCFKPLGFTAEEKSKYLKLPIISSVPINILNYESLNILLTGDISFDDNLNNLQSRNISSGNIIFQKIIDSYSNEILKYENFDGGTNFCFKLMNVNQPSFFKISILDQELNIFKNFPNFYLTLSFTRKKKNDDFKQSIKRIEEYLNYIFLFLSDIVKKYVY